MKYLIILLFPTLCLAMTQDELVDYIKEKCDYTNEIIPFDIREDCTLHYVNCSIGLNGKIDLKDVEKCVANRWRNND